ncbi:sulfotransferase family protein [Glycomyces tenuis]|uniref:sulfotransferase family protein n=1 Tax=Glycomyces tenuis TaxID=58116 RepID=UPI000410A330|nr:sulfotransferase [Glycomyces tenuis]
MKRISNTAHVLNALLAPVSGGRKHPERAWRKVVEQAEANTGGTRAGSESFIDGLRFRFECFSELKLSPLGWQGVLSESRGRLENRFRIQKLIAEHPEIADEPIEAPIFVTGLPRTATTLTHNIIARSEGHRGPLLWELHWTDLEVDAATRAKRIKADQKQTDSLQRLSPMYDLMHPLRADKPEECVYILPHGLHNLVLATMPRYRAFLDEHDFTDDYRYLKQALQVLQHGRPRKRWILKTPEHLFHLDLLMKVFPDAKVVWTHRDPVTVMGSVCSLVETTHLLYVKRPDLKAIGEMWLDLLTSAVERGRAARPHLPPGSLIDVHYASIASNPWEYVPKLYEQLGANWTGQDEAKLDKIMERPIRDRRHEYFLSRYSLAPDRVEDAFGDYTQFVTSLNR